MKRIIIIICLVVVALEGPALAQSASTSFEFMLTGSDARTSAMGEAGAALNHDPGTVYFNPALAGTLSGINFSFMHVAYLTDVTQDNFSVLAKAGRFRYGLGLYLGKVANIARRGDIPTDNPSYFDEHNLTMSLVWGLPVNDRLCVGNAVKWAYEKIDLNSASALALDLGAYYALTSQLSAGASARNLGTRPKFIDESFDLPRELRVGASFKASEKSRLNGATVSADFIWPKWGNGKTRLNLGGEYAYQNLISLRAGYGKGYDSRGLSVGGGLSYQKYFFDYAFVPGRNNLNDTHRFTLRISL